MEDLISPWELFVFLLYSWTAGFYDITIVFVPESGTPNSSVASR